MNFPTPHSVLFVILILAATATWLIPAGQYDTLAYDSASEVLILTSSGESRALAPTQATLDSLGLPTHIAQFTDGQLTRPVKVPDTYRSLGQSGQGPISVLIAAVRGTHETIDIILMVMMIGGFIRLYNVSGVLQTGIQHLAMGLRGYEPWLIVLLTILCAAGGTTFALGEETMAFYPILVPIFLAAGYDRLVPVAVIFIGSRLGIMAATVNPFSVIIASDAAGVSWDSGIAIRIAMLVIGLIVVIVYILRYAERVRRDPTKSLVSLSESAEHLPYSTDIPTDIKPLTLRHKAMLWLFGLTFLTMVLGITMWHWWTVEMAALFLGSGVISGFLLGLNEKTIVSEFIAGAGDMLSVSLIIGLARGITILLNEGFVIDTVLYHTTNLVAGIPASAILTALIGVFFILSFLITSTSGLALLTMPILGALAISNGIPGESIVTAFTFGSGLMFFISPTELILPSLAMVNLKYDTWLKFMLPLLGILAVIAVGLMLIGG